MSTYLYLVCEDHDPPLVAGSESGQHHFDLSQIREDIENRDAIVKIGAVFADNLRSATARFLGQHAQCRIGIQDEYGDRHPVVEVADAPQVPEGAVEAPLRTEDHLLDVAGDVLTALGSGLGTRSAELNVVMSVLRAHLHSVPEAK